MAWPGVAWVVPGGLGSSSRYHPRSVSLPADKEQCQLWARSRERAGRFLMRACNMGSILRMLTLPRTLFVLGSLILFDIAIVRWRGDGMESLSAQEKWAAQEELAILSGTCLDHPIQRLVVRHKRVAEVRFVPGCPGFFHSYNVVIDIYTFFGLHLLRTIHDCRGGVICNY